MHRSGFLTVTTGLDHDGFPMGLYAKALRHGTWNPQSIELLPLIRVVAGQGHLEQELFLTTFRADAAKHTVFVRRVLDEDARLWGVVKQGTTGARASAAELIA